MNGKVDKGGGGPLAMNLLTMFIVELLAVFLLYFVVGSPPQLIIAVVSMTFWSGLID